MIDYTPCNTSQAAFFYYPGTYRRLARKHCLNIAKRKRKTNKQIRRGIREQFQYIA